MNEIAVFTGAWGLAAIWWWLMQIARKLESINKTLERIADEPLCSFSVKTTGRKDGKP